MSFDDPKGTARSASQTGLERGIWLALYPCGRRVRAGLKSKRKPRLYNSVRAVTSRMFMQAKFFCDVS